MMLKVPLIVETLFGTVGYKEKSVIDYVIADNQLMRESGVRYRSF